MVDNNTGDSNSKLKITGLKEPVVWIKDDKDNPTAWGAGVGIAGLIPDLFKGYKFQYTRELISPEGKIVNTGVLSQAPGYMGTSTTVAIGGRELAPGNYIVRIRADNGEQDSMMVNVPDYETYLDRLKQEEEKKRNSPQDKPVKEKITRIKRNNNLKFVNAVYLEEDDDVVLLTVERKDESKYSVVLKDPSEVPYINQVVIDDSTIDIIKESLAIWGNRIDDFAEQYLKDDRKEIEFFNDIVTLARCLSKLPKEFMNILKFGAASDLLHNRIMAQIINEYYSLGFKITLMPSKHTGQKIHDFDASINNSTYSCEIKTIQSIGELEHKVLGGFRLTHESHAHFISSIRRHLEDAKKAGKNGIIIIAPWSYRINALLRKYFEKYLLCYPTAPSANTTLLVLTSYQVFEDYYVSFPTDRVLLILENALSNIQLYGINDLVLAHIREGLTIQAATAAQAGSVAGYIF